MVHKLNEYKHKKCEDDMTQKNKSNEKEIIIGLISLLLALLTYFLINPESFIKPDSTPITLEQINENPLKNYVGKTAGNDITRIQSSEEYQKVTSLDYITVETTEIIPTNIYGIKPWVNPYEITRVTNSRGRLVSAGKKAPEVTDRPLQLGEYYQEYYLVKLMDQSYVLAQLSDLQAKDCQNGNVITLPIGIKKTNSNEVKKSLADICEEYGADSSYTLYMIDDEWYQEHEFSFFVIRIIVAIVVFFVSIFILLGIEERLKKLKVR